MADRTAGPRTSEPLPPKTPVLGVDVSVVDVDGLLRLLERAVETGTPTLVSFVNPNYVMRAHEDPELRCRMNAFDVMLADGWGVVAAARALGVRLPARLSNDDIGPALFGLAAERGWRVFLFGSAPGVADRAARTLRETVPGLHVVGAVHGWFDVLRGHPGRFDPEDHAAILAMIEETRPDLLIVGLPTPLQQRWVIDHRDRLATVPIVMTGGSYLDHVAVRLEWYPRWVLRARVGWLYRLAQDPLRLWRRYSVELVEFGVLLARELLRRRR